ncbi:MAG: DUF4339 domain-containing protein [Bdellovibrio sp.]|nr:DUF4339 domain-containing protein [Bdellovibrio sp.]
MEGWYYVVGQDRKGPVSFEEIMALASNGTLVQDSYVWRKGLDGWKKMKELSEFSTNRSSDIPQVINSIPPTMKPTAKFDWHTVDSNKKIFTIRIGPDRGQEIEEYGPFALDAVKSLLNENRINGKSLIFAPGMEEWIFITDTPLFDMTSGKKNLPPVIAPEERRKYVRRPFVARLLFHNNEDVCEGICRDISIGGLQILVADFPVSKGDVIQLNVHPDNSSVSFVAKGKIVRILEGRRGFSIRFEGLSTEAQASILKYVESDES